MLAWLAGAGYPHLERLPYFPQEAAAELKKYQLLLLLDVRRPVAAFGYR
jgi:acetolactate synthase-1/2/3 large subunit